jgi:hypothetical protein
MKKLLTFSAVLNLSEASRTLGVRGHARFDGLPASR